MFHSTVITSTASTFNAIFTRASSAERVKGAINQVQVFRGIFNGSRAEWAAFRQNTCFSQLTATMRFLKISRLKMQT